MFGGITIVCGILGTLSGGIILDKIGATIPNAFKVLAPYPNVRHRPTASSVDKFDVLYW
ncbi:hypothetical protein SEVIR_8G120650v4 [Setaria viridis]